MGTEYKTSPKELKYYKLVEMPSNSSGKYTDGETVVTYTYENYLSICL